jgi:hypothetical protein
MDLFRKAEQQEQDISKGFVMQQICLSELEDLTGQANRDSMLPLVAFSYLMAEGEMNVCGLRALEKKKSQSGCILIL